MAQRVPANNQQVMAVRRLRSRRRARAAIMYTLIQTARLNDVDPQAWLADVLARINDHKITDLAALLPWRWPPSESGVVWRHERRHVDPSDLTRGPHRMLT